MMWFRWENVTGQWEPVVYRGSPVLYDPAIMATEFVRVPKDCIGDDGEPMFGMLKAMFPMEDEGQG